MISTDDDDDDDDDNFIHVSSKDTNNKLYKIINSQISMYKLI